MINAHCPHLGLYDRKAAPSAVHLVSYHYDYGGPHLLIHHTCLIFKHDVMARLKGAVLLEAT